jgi:hypothetical protein
VYHILYPGTQTGCPGQEHWEDTETLDLQLGRISLAAALLIGTMLTQTAGTGTLAGTVTDSTGAVVNADTSFVSETVTSTEGSYHAPHPAPGTFARMTGVQGFLSTIGSGRPNICAIVRFEF